MFGVKETNSQRRAASIFAASALAALIGFGASELTQHYYSRSGIAQAGAAPEESRAALPNFAALDKKMGPAVVNISTVQMRKTAQQSPSSPFGDDDGANDLFQRFFGGR